MADYRDLTPNQRLVRAREKAGYQTASEAARAFGWNENTYRSHENGERGLRLDVAARYARQFKCSLFYLLFGIEGPEVLAEYKVPSEIYNKLIGYIDADGQYKDYPAHGHGGHVEKYVETDVYVSNASWTAEIRSSRPILGCYPKDLLIISPNRVDPKEYIGKLAIVETDSGAQLLRRIRLSNDANKLDISLHPELGSENVDYREVNLIFVIIQSSFWQEIEHDAYQKLKAQRNKPRLRF